VPDAYINQWGADTFRMYLMFLGPFQEGGDFRDEGITGIRRFLEKVWVLAHEASATPATSGTTPGLRPGSGVPDEVVRKLHQTVRKVASDLDALQYNTAIAAMMEYVNEVRSAGCTDRRAVEPLVVMLAPFAPHLAEELWEVLGHQGTVFDAGWPKHDDALAALGDVEIVVQVNGKVRGRLSVTRGVSQQDVESRAFADESVKKFLDGKEPRKVVYVQDRILNIVV